MANDCGGCAGKGAHRRYCPWVVGANASIMGGWADRAESLGDSVGPNEMGAANHLWAAASLLRKGAAERALEFQRETGARRDGKRE
jgi:hypothetical protein